mmetsp:Transcript_6068/g.10035  ORF Transcript_6068/g.10035 Transcript_6068/m.10035 type:complete len:295 (+) Transcript_6068:159-1043(+)
MPSDKRYAVCDRCGSRPTRWAEHPASRLSGPPRRPRRSRLHRLEFGLQRVDTRQQRRHRLLDVLGDDVDLEVDEAADGLGGDDDLLLRVRHEHEVEPAFLGVHLAHGEARAVHGDEPLRHDVREQPRRRAHLDPQRVALRTQLLDDADVVDVPLHEVAAVAPVGRERALQVDRVARRQRAHVRALHRLWRQAHLERPLIELGHREAHAVHGDAAAEGGLVEHFGGLDVHLPPLAHTPVPELQPRHLLQAADAPHLLHDAGEHRARRGAAAEEDGGAQRGRRHPARAHAGEHRRE